MRARFSDDPAFGDPELPQHMYGEEHEAADALAAQRVHIYADSPGELLQLCFGGRYDEGRGFGESGCIRPPRRSSKRAGLCRVSCRSCCRPELSHG